MGFVLGKICKLGAWPRNGFQFWGSLAVFFVGVVILVFDSRSYFVMGIELGNIRKAICLFRIIWLVDGYCLSRPYGDSQMIQSGAHIVLVLRYLLANKLKDAFRDKIMSASDLILHVLAVKFICIFLKLLK